MILRCEIIIINLQFKIQDTKITLYAKNKEQRTKNVERRAQTAQGSV